MSSRFPVEEARIRRAYHRYDVSPDERAKRDVANAGNRAIERERDLWLRRCLAEVGVPTGEARAMDVGCGTGTVLQKLVAFGADPSCLVGVDILEDRIEIARSQSPEIHFERTSVDRLPFPDRSFELAIAFTLFSSILDPTLSQEVAREIVRVLKPGAPILWYDSRLPNPFNRDVRAVGKREIQRLFPGSRAQLHSITVLPPLSRRLGPSAAVLYSVLATLPMLRVRYIGVIWPAAAGAQSGQAQVHPG